MKLFAKKPKKEDFLESGLPSSRPALFWDVLRNEYRKLMGVALLLLIFALPFLALHFFVDAYVIALENSGSENAIFPHYLFLAFNPFATMIFGLGVGSLMRIIKRLCYLEPVFFFEDWKAGIKQNGRQSALGGFLIGLFFSGTYLFHLLRPEELLWDMPLGIFALIIYPIFLFSFPIIATYKTNWNETYSLSARIYLKAFLTNLLPLAAFLTPYLFEMIPDLVVKYIAIFFFLLFVAPLILLAFFLYESYLLDKYINKEKYPELYDRGIHRKKGN